MAQWQDTAHNDLLSQGVVWRMSRAATRTSQALATTFDEYQMRRMDAEVVVMGLHRDSLVRGWGQET